MGLEAIRRFLDVADSLVGKVSEDNESRHDRSLEIVGIRMAAAGAEALPGEADGRPRRQPAGQWGRLA